jgi:hypothetical protein
VSKFSMPVREGPRPKTGDQVPHLQLSDNSPPDYVDELMEWAVSRFPDVREEPTRISVSTTRALWLDESVSVAHDDAFMPPAGGREFAHVHADGSMHLCVSDEAVRELVEKSWGEPHPMKDQGVNEVLCYAPRTREEIEIVKLALIESYRYATGRELPLEQGE